MELYLQFGYGMMEHSRHLIDQWGGGTVILSPRDLTNRQLHTLSNDITGRGGTVLLDPQFYLPRADHHRLTGHQYWPGEYDSFGFYQGPGLEAMIQNLLELNQSLNCDAMILPGIHGTRIDDDWLEVHRAILQTAQDVSAEALPLMPTFCVSAEAMREEIQIHNLLETIEEWEYAGCYLVCEHPNGEYLVEDPVWLANVLDLAAGLKLHGRKVVIGYCNHQMLISSAAAVDAIASGTWMNVRSFPPDKFRAALEEEIRQRRAWYYCPQALSEFAVPFLDIAFRRGVLDDMRPPAHMPNDYVEPLFKGIQPSTAGLNEREAFRHYLSCLYVQVKEVNCSTFADTIAVHNRALLPRNQVDPGIFLR